VGPFDRGFGFFAEMAILGYSLFLLPVAALGLGLPYMVLRLRTVPAEEQDSQIGLKCVLYFVFSLGILMFLTGLTILVADLMMEGDWFIKSADRLKRFDTTHRNAAALMLSGGLFAFVHLILLLGYTNNRRYPEVRRVWVGWRFAIHSMVVLLATTMVILVLFSEVTDARNLQLPLSILLVWGPSWLIHLALLKFYRGMGSPPPKPIRRARPDDDYDRPVRPILASGPQQRQSQTGPPARPAPGNPPRPATEES